MNENELISSIREYLSDIVKDKEAFIHSVLFELKKEQSLSNAKINETDLKKKIKQLHVKKEKYQEMYAADVLSISELKEKTTQINKEIEELTICLDKICISNTIKKNNMEDIRRYTEEIESFLKLENVTNMDLKKIISHIVVNRDGDVKIHLRNLADFISE